MKNFVNFIKNLFKKQSKIPESMSGLSTIQFQELLIKYPELKNAVMFAPKEVIELITKN